MKSIKLEWNNTMNTVDRILIECTKKANSVTIILNEDSPDAIRISFPDKGEGFKKFKHDIALAQQDYYVRIERNGAK